MDNPNDVRTNRSQPSSRLRNAAIGILACASNVIWGTSALGQNDQPTGYFNLQTKTWGGQQYWTDYENRLGWRIQKNLATGHSRLLDPHDVRHAWGNQAHCELELERISKSVGVEKPNGRVIILLHGLIRTQNSLNDISNFLSKQTGATLINFEYASCKAPIEDHAKALEHLIDKLGAGVTRIDFVGHSMGNIVVRRYLAELELEGRSNQLKPRFGRMVMLGPPNQGSKMARILNNSLIFNGITGASGFQLGKGWSVFEKSLTTPPFEFAIISGGKLEKSLIDNWLLNGPNDLTVDLQETKLVGAADSSLQVLYHGTMMKDPQVLQQIHSFLENGYLVAPDRVQPILNDSDVP